MERQSRIGGRAARQGRLSPYPGQGLPAASRLGCFKRRDDAQALRSARRCLHGDDARDAKLGGSNRGGG